MSASKKTNARGFTLVEMAVVLVVIGLIVGGIAVGKNLIRNAQLQSVLTEFDEYKKAVSRFQEKYAALPGDMPDATTYWGTDTNGCPGTAGSTTRTSLTCNGDGNGKIDGINEPFRAWQQLAAAAMIPGSYPGTSNSAIIAQAIIAQNVPNSKLAGAGWQIRYISGGGELFATNSSMHALNLGGTSSAAAGWLNGKVLTTQEAYSIDSKVDDGLPAYGTVMTYTNTSANAGGCASTDTASTAVYLLSTSGMKCMLLFGLGF